MMYLLMAILGAAAGWYMVTYMKYEISMTLAVVIGAAGGLLGTLIGSLLSFAAVILFKIVMALGFAYVLIRLWQRYTASSGK